ncbi:MAG TPA: AMP-binding protein, partial [Pyrinomonadaceae bacterium]
MTTRITTRVAGGGRETRPDRGPAPRPARPETIVEVVRRALTAKARPDALNYKRDGAWHPISSEELLGRVRRVALGLHALGLRPGERAGILSESSPEWVVADLGCQHAGVVNVPVYPTLAPQQVCYIMEDSGSRLLFAQDAATLGRVREAVGDCPALAHAVVMQGDAEGGALTLAGLEARGEELERERPGLLEEISGAVSAEDLATIIYTSGTTGEPKGVMLTHSNVVSNLVDTSDRLAFTPDDVVLSVLPLS